MTEAAHRGGGCLNLRDTKCQVGWGSEHLDGTIDVPGHCRGVGVGVDNLMVPSNSSYAMTTKVGKGHSDHLVQSYLQSFKNPESTDSNLGYHLKTLILDMRKHRQEDSVKCFTFT